jgi:ethanolamine ammonia-lyase small subunit
MDVEHIVKEVLKELEGRLGQENKTGNPEKEKSNIEKHVEYIKEKKVSVDNPINVETIRSAQEITPARIGIGRTGTRMKTANYLDFLIDHAAAQDAVFKDVDESVLKELNLPVLKSTAKDQEEYLMNLDAGRKLDEASVEWLKQNAEKGKQVQIIVSDGLSSTGTSETVPDLMSALIQGLKLKNITIGTPVFIKRSRVWIQDEVAKLVDCDVVISLIGERPGLATSKSISAYIIYRPNEKSVEADRTVFSNIHEGGVPPAEAGAHLADTISEMLKFKSSGVKFAQRLE